MFNLGRQWINSALLAAEGGSLFAILNGKIARISLEGPLVEPNILSPHPVRAGFGHREIGGGVLGIADRLSLHFLDMKSGEVVHRELDSGPSFGLISNDRASVVGFTNRGEHQPPTLEVLRIETGQLQKTTWGREEIRCATWDDKHQRFFVCNNEGRLACFDLEAR
jgi:hypothetical protein